MGARYESRLISLSLCSSGIHNNGFRNCLLTKYMISAGSVPLCGAEMPGPAPPCWCAIQQQGNKWTSLSRTMYLKRRGNKRLLEQDHKKSMKPSAQPFAEDSFLRIPAFSCQCARDTLKGLESLLAIRKPESAETPKRTGLQEPKNKIRSPAYVRIVQRQAQKQVQRKAQPCDC